MTDEEITVAILSVDENDELSKDMVEQVLAMFLIPAVELLRGETLVRNLRLPSIFV